MTMLEKLAELSEDPLWDADCYCPSHTEKYGISFGSNHPECKMTAFKEHNPKLCVSCWLREYEPK